jgi:hypothetical protein
MRRSILPVLAVVILLGQAAPVAADDGLVPVTIEADLDGAPIPIADIPSYACHDLDYPRIHCFRSAAARSVAMFEGQDAAGSATLTAVVYVVAYASQSYGGPSITISQDYDTLALIGWNDRIRSFRGRNGETGVFWTDWFATGSSLSFCCNVNDPSLPSTFDRAITSVYRT